MLENLLSRFCDNVVLISPEHQRAFEGCLGGLSRVAHLPDLMAQSGMSDDGYWLDPSHPRAAWRPYIVRDGVLQIPVKGALLAEFSWQIGSWATGYAYIDRAVERGVRDPAVRAIALIVNSPGGHAAENFDLADKLFSYRQIKPIRAFVSEIAYSAAYSLASCASHISVSRLGGVGSIGVLTSHVDMSKAMEDAGLKITLISSPENGHKTDGNAFEALNPVVRARMQSRIDGIYDVFVRTVARNRGVTELVVRATGALTYSADEATSIGLIDGTGVLETFLAAYAAEIATAKGDVRMADIMRDDHERIVTETRAAALAEGRQEGMNAGREVGARSERERISAILASEEAGTRPKAALSTALKSGMDVDQARSFLADLPEEKLHRAAAGDDSRQRFDLAMRQDRPNLDAGDGGAGDPSPANLAKAFGLSGF